MANHHHHEANANHNVVHGKPDGAHVIHAHGAFQVKAHTHGGKVTHIEAVGPNGMVHVSKIYRRHKS